MRLVPYSALLPLALMTTACQPAGRFTPPRLSPPEKPKEKPPPPPNFDLTWQRPDRDWERRNRPVTLVYVDRKGKDREVWARLPANRIWHDIQPRPNHTDNFLALLPWDTAAQVVVPPEMRSVLIRVPLGLPNPTGRIPDTNPPTKAKWLLGKRLFFDNSWMSDNGSVTCAGCHQPDRGYTDGARHGGVRTPSLLNCVYNDSQFADGRATHLEEVVGSAPADEAASADGSFRHAWGGVERLRKNESYVQEFREAFGCEPTQDAVGKALATYLRTLLSGNSLHDRAIDRPGEFGKIRPTAGDYQRVLADRQTQAVLRDLLNAPGMADYKDLSTDQLAGKLSEGYRRFAEGEPGRPTRCVACHSGKDELGEMTFSDQGFHNLGVGAPFEPKDAAGRFGRVPVGMRERHQIGAFKTPRLRSLARVGPYMHDAAAAALYDVVAFHLRGGQFNDYLDPVMLDINNQHLEYSAKRVHPTDPNYQLEVAARDLTLLLLALEGDTPEDFIRKPPS
jgi:cytochrome c peroxidase